MYDKKFVKIYGLPRSGTNYVEKILNLNFNNINVLTGGNITGWKHGKVSDHNPVDWTGKNWNMKDESWDVIEGYLSEIKPYKSDLMAAVEEGTMCYIFVLKHPWSWFDSYYRYCKKYGLKLPSPKIAANHYNTYNIDYYNFHLQKPLHRLMLRYDDFNVYGLSTVLDSIKDKFGFIPSGDVYKDEVMEIGPSNVIQDNAYKPKTNMISEDQYLEMRHYVSTELLLRIGYEKQ
jgi:hypothetical protein